MVYHGPSRGCETCKDRRKKHRQCDENRPSCLRCLKSGRTCRGYEYSGNLIFRQHQTNGNQSLPQPIFKSMARKCSLPAREVDPETGLLSQDSQPDEISDEDMKICALQAFFYDYCISSPNSSLSGGFLSGLESMVRKQGLDTPVADACKAAAFASHGIKLHRKFLIYQAEILHQNLLQHLAICMKTSQASSKETLVIAVLLGLYQMIISGEGNPGHHSTHAAGVAAILQIENNPSHILQTIITGHPMFLSNKQHIDVGSPQRGIVPDRSLSDILIKLTPTWKQTEILLIRPQNSHAWDLAVYLVVELTRLDNELEAWQQSQNQEFNPVTLDSSGVAPSPDAGAGYWPGRVDMYIDLYIATLWNISRIARCMIKDLTIKLSMVLGDNSTRQDDHQAALNMAEDIIASLPCHLSEDLQIFLKERHNHTKITNPGRPAGGLLIMHILFAASQLDILPLEMRGYFKKCLVWMGKRMGIGQAAFLAQAPEIDTKYLMDGLLLILSGLLI